MKKILSMLLAIIILLSLVTVPVTAGTAAAVNEEITALYGLNTWAEEYLEIPPDCMTSYQINMPGNYACISGDSVEVSDAGLVTPRYTITYWYGNIGFSQPIEGKPWDEMTKEVECGKSVVRVTSGEKVTDFTFDVKDYAVVYADGVLDEYIKNNIPDDLPLYDANDKNNKLDRICAFPAQYDYSAGYSSAVSMIVVGGGDCWASTDAIIRLCEKLGIDARVRNGNRDSGAGSGHINALITVEDGNYCELEAGYVGEAPRLYTIKHRTSLFCYRDLADSCIDVYQYDGDKEDTERLVVPDIIDGKTVTSIGDYFISMNSFVKEAVLPETVDTIGKSAFNSCTALTLLHLPAAVSSIGQFAFTACTALTDFTCAVDNPYFTIKDGILYDKAMNKVISGPACTQAVLPDTVETVGEYAFYYNGNLTKAVLGSAAATLEEGAFANSALKKIDLGKVQTIGRAAFGSCRQLSFAIIPDGITVISEMAFCDCAELTTVWLPVSVTTIDGDAFSYCSSLSNIYYAGTEEQKNAIQINSGNEYLINAAWHYNSVEPISAPEPKSGDYDCSSVVNVQDAIMTLRAAMKLVTPSGQSLLNADTDGSGTLTVTDAVIILRMAMGLV